MMAKKIIRRCLELWPKLYLLILVLLKRGSIEKRVFLAVLRRGDVVFDIGANRGDFARLFSRLVGPRGQVHAFEPVPTTFKVLERTVQSCGNVVVNNCALGNADGAVVLHLPGNDDGQASLRVHSGGSWLPSVSVIDHQCRMTTLDKYAENLTKIDFIKCDVEGAERLVLTGAVDSLRRHSPLLFVEIEPLWMSAFDSTTADIIADLRLLGYDTFRMVTDKVGPPEMDCSGVSGNMIAAKLSIHQARLAALSLT